MKILAFCVGLLLPVALAISLASGPSGTTQAALTPPADAEPATKTSAAVPTALESLAADLIRPQDAVAAKPIPIGIDPFGAERAWRNWMARHNIQAGAMALGMNGEILFTDANNRRSDALYPVASLSKAITAMCLNDVLADSEFTWSSTLEDLTPALATINMSPHPGVQPLRLSELASHTSGFAKNFDGDETAGEGRNLYTQQHFAREALTNADRKRKDGRFSYSNVNYAVLGQVITALSGVPYGEVCAARIMVPAGAKDAAVGGRMWATGGFGGWAVSAEDYAKFVMHWLAPDRPWIATPSDFAYDEKSGASLGVFFRVKRNAFMVTHSGLWRHKNPERQHGALFMITETGATFVANWQGHLKNKAYDDLRDEVVPYLR